MTLHSLDDYFRSFLNIDDYSQDPSKNGIQVQNAQPATDKITTVAFAVDACVESIEQAVRCNAQVLVVHHGLFWGHEQTIVASHYERIKRLIEANIALYACHVPLDANEEVGNNYGLARQIGLDNLEPFGTWASMSIGVKGLFSEPKTMESIAKDLFSSGERPTVVLPFGKKDITKVAIVSGGAGDLLSEAIDSEMDLYITGEISHESYHCAKEAQINVIAGGHYNTETIGVSLLAKKLQKEKGIDTVLLDIPTGL